MQIRRSVNAQVLAAIAVLAIFAIVQRADAATIIVNSLADPGASGICALRDAITAANTAAAVNGCAAGSGDDTIVFGVTGTIAIGSKLPNIVNTLTIQGPAVSPPEIAIDGAGKYQVMVVNSGATVSLLSLRITGGGSIEVINGGGIYNGGTLTLTDSAVAGSAGFGGGIFNSAGATLTVTNSSISGEGYAEAGGIDNGGTLTLTNSTIDNSRGDFGAGGISNGGTLKVINSTLSGNSGSINGTDNGGGIDNFGELTVTNSTFANNFAGHGGAICDESESSTTTVTNSIFLGNFATESGGGIDNFPFRFPITGTVNVKGTIFVANLESASANCNSFFGKPFNDLGYNLSDDNSCRFSQSTSANDVLDEELNLDPNGLQDNGGPTETVALESGSIAINKIPVADCTDQSSPPVQIATDQRGVIRPQFTACDIGAYEYNTARSLKTAALNAIQNTTGGNAADNSALKFATSNLAQAVCFYWSGTSGNELSPVAGILDFLAEERAVNALAGTLIPSSQLPAATVENYLFNIVLADRTLAVVAITNAGGNADASQLVDQGDAQAAAGDYFDAIISYQKAWSLVTASS